ncbi:hypothetical protein DDF62_00920 [Caulobacter radicis]|uniref:hypothetical protein n=1 Tax=Caulobacter radicis TaxID=2172650 RepID=UPI000D5894CE|nr:hypothetical protein [Caulobacter radicis]PVM93402.1 hypothetical protein DDF62_00920 [Caulobacter radicis]
MQQTGALKLTVYKPDIVADGQVGFEYELTLVTPEGKSLASSEAALETGSTARCEVVPVTGELSFPNPAAPVISPFTGVMFIYDNAPAIGFPLSIMISSTSDELLKFRLNLCFPSMSSDPLSGSIVFGDWPGPLSNVAASFLSPQV